MIKLKMDNKELIGKNLKNYINNGILTLKLYKIQNYQKVNLFMYGG